MSESYIGQIIAFGGTFAIRNFAFCQGQTIAVNQNQALFSILGTTYGGNGQSTFQLPNLVGRSVVGVGTNSTLGGATYTLGQVGGALQATLNLTQIPAHTHTAATTTNTTTTTTINALAGPGDNVNPGTSRILAGAPAGNTMYSNQTPNTTLAPGAATSASTSTSTTTVQSAGGNLPFSILSPFIAINYLVALQGLYPARN